MGKCVISFENYVQNSATSLNANGSEVAGQGISRLKDPQIRRRWRTPVGVIGPIFDVDFQNSKPIDVIALLQPIDAGGLSPVPERDPLGMASPADLVRNLFSLASPFAFDVYDTGYIPLNIKTPFGIFAKVLPNQINARYWRCNPVCSSLSGSVNYFDLGMAWAGAKFVPANNMQYGYQWSFVDTSVVDNSPTSGVDFIRYGFKRRNINFSFDSLNPAEAEIISKMQRSVGNSKQVLFIPDPDDVTSDFAQPIIGRLVDANPLTVPYPSTTTKAFTLIQSL